MEIGLGCLFGGCSTGRIFNVECCCLGRECLHAWHLSSILSGDQGHNQGKSPEQHCSCTAYIWNDFPPFMVLVIAILNDGTIMTISKDRVKPSPKPDNWKLNEIFTTSIVIGTYLALVTTHFHLRSLSLTNRKVSSCQRHQPNCNICYSQSKLVICRKARCSIDVCISGGSAGCYRDSSLCKCQLRINPRHWMGLGCCKLQTAFTSKKDYGKEDREAKWVLSQRLLEGINSTDLDTTGWRSSILAGNMG
ncbi:hypothetical protein C5167_027588 [Papaver somniferum]|nr:hypothetical protein C5167_027588 [Papaver somniferum]